MVGSALTLLSCAPQNTFVAPPPPQVEVGPPIIEETRVYMAFPGRTEATARVEVRARVKGFLLSRDFQAGNFVKKGDLLFTIEPDQFEAGVVTAEGNLARAKADLEIATTNWEKRKIAFEKSGAVSELDVLSAEAEKKAASANVDIAQAALNDANRDLTYTKIVAPISGRVSRSLVDQGNLVGSNEPTLLTNVVKDRPIYFNFEVSERAAVPYLKSLPNADNPEMTPLAEEENELELSLSDGTDHAELGRIEFVDNAINSKTGTLKLRALFDNKDGGLVDGAFGRIRIPKRLPDAVKVPIAIVQRDLGGTFVLVVNSENVVERRSVFPTPNVADNYRIIEPYDEEKNSGVKSDDKIVMSNLQRARPGIEVVPVALGTMSAKPNAPEPTTVEGSKKPSEKVEPAE